jgi:hypothetical protein
VTCGDDDGGGVVVGGNVTGAGRGGTVVGGSVIGTGRGGTVVVGSVVTGGAAGGGFVTLGEEVAVFPWPVVGWPVVGWVAVAACEPEGSVNARPIPTAATAAITAKTIPSRLLILGSFDSLVESENHFGCVPAGISDLFIRW